MRILYLYMEGMGGINCFQTTHFNAVDYLHGEIIQECSFDIEVKLVQETFKSFDISIHADKQIERLGIIELYSAYKISQSAQAPGRLVGDALNKGRRA